MKIKLSTSLIVTFSLFIIFQSCNKEIENNNETKISSQGTDNGHNMGQNCMNCHKPGGAGEGVFTIAGTVYDSLKTNTFPDATVKLYSGPNGTGTLKYTIMANASGNFYTTQNLDFGIGLYPSVQGPKTTMFMPTAITTGQCNSCHGVSADKIWTK